MLTIHVAGWPLWLKPGTSLSLEINNPALDQDVVRGAYSYAFTLPLNRENRAVFGYPEVVENVADLRRVFDDCQVAQDGWVIGAGGQLRIRQVLPTALSVVIGFGLSGLAPALRERKLASFAFGGWRSVPPTETLANGAVVPGLVHHANQVVADPARYDYVFAPVLNHSIDQAATATQPALGPLVFNPWTFTEPGLFGLPAYGSFSFSLALDIPGGAVALDYLQNLPANLFPAPMAPFPRLAYLVRSLFQELGVPVSDEALTGELAELVLLHSNLIGYAFSLAHTLPDLTATDFLQRLKTALGLVPDFGPDGRVTLRLLRDIAADAAYEEWSHLAAPAFLERAVPEVAGVTLGYELASNDPVAEAFYQPAADLPEGDAVATRADLPATGIREERRLVRSESQYYRCRLVAWQAGTVLLSWEPLPATYGPVVVVPGAEAVTGQGLTATALERQPDALAGAYVQEALLPSLAEKPYAFGQPAEERGALLRLAFYRGRQPYVVNPTHPLYARRPDYPLVTPLDQDATGTVVGEHSLQLHGEAGTVNRLLGRWLALVATATPVKRLLYLTPEHLAGLQLNRKKMIDGNLYLVQQVSVSVPITKAATVTLIPLPRG